MASNLFRVSSLAFLLTALMGVGCGKDNSTLQRGNVRTRSYPRVQRRIPQTPRTSPNPITPVVPVRRAPTMRGSLR